MLLPPALPLRPRLPAAALCLALAAAPAAAQDAAARAYDLPAQPLNATVARIASDSGARISVDAELARNITAAPVRGSLTAEAAMQQALAGSGLELVRTGSGVLTVRRAAAVSASSAPAATASATLREVTVAAVAERSDATEGTGSYVARSSTVGSKTGQSLREVPQSVSVVARQQIEDTGLTTLPDALMAMPGVTVFGTALLTDRSLSRGFEMGANMRVDGGAVAELRYGIDNDLAFYDRVEVLRGADGLFGGNGEPGGVANLVRKKPTREKQIIVQGQYGSHNFKRADLDVSGPLTEDGRVRGRAVLAHEDKGFFFDVADSKRTLAYGVLEADLTRDTTVTVGATYVQRDSSIQGYGLPRASTGEDLRLPRTIYLSGADDHADKRIETVFGQFAHRFSGDWRLDVALNHERATQERYDQYFYGAADLATGQGTAGRPTLQDERWRNTAVDASLKGSFGLLGRRHDAMIGADWSRLEQRSDVKRHVPYVTPTIPDIHQFNPYDYRQPAGPLATSLKLQLPVEQASIYGSARFHVTDPLRVIVGGRVSRYHYRYLFDMFDPSGEQTLSDVTDYRDNNVFTPYLAATYDLNKTWTAYASIAETFMSQAGSRSGPEPGTPLDPITGRNYELGIKGSHLDGRLQSAFAIYRIERDGAAVPDTNYPASTGPLGSSCCYLGTGQIVSKGFDAELTGELVHGLQVALSYSYNDNRNKNAEGQPRFNGLNPEHLLKVFATYRLPGTLGRWKLGGGVTAQSKTFVDGSAYVRNADGTVSDQTTSYRFTQRGYAIASAHVEYQIDDRWTVSLNVNNLFDKTYYSTIGTLDYGSLYGAPRNAMLTLRGKF